MSKKKALKNYKVCLFKEKLDIHFYLPLLCPYILIHVAIDVSAIHKHKLLWSSCFCAPHFSCPIRKLTSLEQKMNSSKLSPLCENGLAQHWVGGFCDNVNGKALCGVLTLFNCLCVVGLMWSWEGEN